MTQGSQKYIIGNWKMYGHQKDSIIRARSLVEQFDAGRRYPFTLVICPPAVFLEGVAQEIQGSSVKLGAQNCHWKNQGAFTGDISPSMLVDVGCTYVILGHSEQRQNHHETNAKVAQKAQCALGVGLIPIVCIGETKAQRQQHRTQAIIEQQVMESLPRLSAQQRVILSYEPIWAIGTQNTAPPQDIYAILSFIITLLKNYESRIPLLYGGSITPQNASDIVSLDVVDGLLIGRASLDVNAFWAIANTVTS